MPRFSLRYLDSAFEYSAEWTADEFAPEVMSFLHAFGTTKWEELRRQTTGSGTRRPRYHPHEFDEVRDEAQERLEQLGHDAVFERLVRYRTNGRGRAWGFEVEGVFYLLWWDTEHAVYPVGKK